MIKAGGVVVATMPLLRAKELSYPLAKAKIADRALRRAAGRRDGEGQGAVTADLKRIVYWGSGVRASFRR